MKQHETALIADNVSLGEDVKIFGFANLYGCKIGKNTRIGNFVEIQKGVTIGAQCKISTHTFICEGVTIEDEVFVGHNVCFCNDMFPRACNESGDMAGEADWTCTPTHIEKGASIGSGTTLLPGIRIGTNALIGAGSVVTKSVPAHAIVAGNPAKIIRYIK